MASDAENTRVFIRGHFKFFYEVKPEEIIVQLIWDTRQNLDEFPIRQ